MSYFVITFVGRLCNCYYFSLSVLQNISIHCISVIVLLPAVIFCEINDDHDEASHCAQMLIKYSDME